MSPTLPDVSVVFQCIATSVPTLAGCSQIKLQSPVRHTVGVYAQISPWLLATNCRARLTAFSRTLTRVLTSLDLAAVPSSQLVTRPTTHSEVRLLLHEEKRLHVTCLLGPKLSQSWGQSFMNLFKGENCDCSTVCTLSQHCPFRLLCCV